MLSLPVSNIVHMVGYSNIHSAIIRLGRSVFDPPKTFAASFDPYDLYTDITNGLWLDPSDYSTLFQNAAGTVPVTAVEQPVGLMLDKSKGLVLGPELVTNGGFDTDTDWVKGTGWTIDGGVATFTNPGFASPITQNILTVNKHYRLTFTVSGASINVRPYFGTYTGSQYYTAAGTYTVNFQAGSDVAFGFQGVSGAAFSIDNISVRELPGNHAFNPSGNSANFPVLSARVNLLTKTEDFSDGVWNRDNAVITANAATAPDGTLTADRLVGSGRWYTQQRVTLATGVSYTVSCYVKSNTGVLQTFRLYGSNNITSSDLTATTEWKRFTFSFTAALDDGHGIARNTAGDPNDLLVWGADLRVANDALGQPAYQRVNTATDYDTVGFKPYLKFNGTNQWLQTNSIDFTYGDKMTVFAGVRKLSDAATGVIAELSTSINNAGSFLLTGIEGLNKYNYISTSGFIREAKTISATYAAPVTNVVTGITNFAGPQTLLRLNGAQVASDTGSYTAGAFGNYPLYIGARAGSSLWFNGRMYGLVVTGKQTSAAEITSTETYINNKTGAYL